MTGDRLRSRGGWWLVVSLALALTGCASMFHAFGGGMTPELYANSVPASATVLEIWDTGWTINDDPVIGMKVRVHPADRPDFEGVIEKTTVSRIAVAQFQPGAVIPVRFDPQNPGMIAVDPGTPPPGTAPPSGEVASSTGNPFRDGYKPSPATGRLLPGEREPQVFLGTGDSAGDSQALYENSYTLLGGAAVPPGADLRQALEQAHEIHADIVVVYGSFARPEGMALDVLPYRPLAVEAGGIPSSRWEAPLSVGGDQRLAAYWAKTQRPILGVMYRPYATEETKSKGGLVVDGVDRNSPAAEVGIATGDVLVAIDGRKLVDVKDVTALIMELAGKTVRIDLIHAGEPSVVIAKLNPAAP